jgi:hypothetical protein
MAMWPRIRLRPWQVLLVVGLLACSGWFLLRWDSDTGETRGIGHVSVQVAFYVCEDESGAPVAAATIRMADPDYISDPMEPYVLQLTTGPDGRASKLFGLT